MSASRTLLGFAASWLLVAGAAAGAGFWAASQRQAALEAGLVARAERCAVAFVTEDTAALTGTPADAGTAAYLAVRDRLRRLRDVGGGVRFVYLFRSTSVPGRVVFLADSEPEDSPDHSAPGSDYPEALASPGLQEALRTHQPAMEGPLRDSFGVWFTAYAPVGDRPLPGAPRIVLGVDVDSSDWTRQTTQAAAGAAGLVLLALGGPLGVVQFLRKERRLNREIRRLSAAIQQSQSAVVIATPDRVIDYANDGAQTVTGYTRAELAGQPMRLLAPDDMPEAEREAVLARLRAGERWQGELRIRRRNGEVFPARVSLSPVRGEDGRLAYFVGIFDDISDLKRGEQELRVARDQARAADRAKGEFLAVMSHELRTPLNGIIGFASLLRDTPLNHEQADYAETIQRSGEALLALTNELLDYSRIDAGRMQLEPQPTEPRTVVEEAVELLSTRSAEKGLELLVAVASDVPARVVADSGRLRQVLMNLAGNAIKFTPAGEVEVGLAWRSTPDEGADRGRLEFVVRDSGIGIAVDQHERLFRPFSQLDSSNTRRHGGAGLGLAISRSLVELMGGTIEFESLPGAGSVFRFQVPVRILEVGEPPAPLGPRRVAVVSAHARTRALLAGQLGRWGLEVRAFEGLDRLGADEADAVVVDIPLRDAAQWPELARSHAFLRGRPVIGLVPVGVPGPIRDELRAALRALLKKPARESLLHSVLRGVFAG